MWAGPRDALHTRRMRRDVTAAVVGSRAEAELMAGMLRANGVRAWVSTDDAGGVEAALTAQGVRVMVASDSAAAAARLVGMPSADPGHLNIFQRWVVRLLGGGRGTPR
jgi:hypothetical protein